MIDAGIGGTRLRRGFSTYAFLSRFTKEQGFESLETPLGSLFDTRLLFALRRACVFTAHKFTSDADDASGNAPPG